MKDDITRLNKGGNQTIDWEKLGCDVADELLEMDKVGEK